MLIRAGDEHEEDDEADDGEHHDEDATEHPIVSPGAIHRVPVVHVQIIILRPGNGQVHFHGNLATPNLQ